MDSSFVQRRDEKSVNLGYTSVSFQKPFDSKAKEPQSCNAGELFATAIVIIPGCNQGRTALPNYRFYRLDGAGKITHAEWIEAAGDEDARGEARGRAPEGSFELWEKHRLVERFGTGQAG